MRPAPTACRICDMLRRREEELTMLREAPSAPEAWRTCCRRHLSQLIEQSEVCAAAPVASAVAQEAVRQIGGAPPTGSCPVCDDLRGAEMRALAELAEASGAAAAAGTCLDHVLRAVALCTPAPAAMLRAAASRALECDLALLEDLVGDWPATEPPRGRRTVSWLDAETALRRSPMMVAQSSPGYPWYRR
jgi:hypothetical protein